MKLQLQRFSYRFAEEVLNSKLALKQELEGILQNPKIDIPSLSRPNFNTILNDLFVLSGWEKQPLVLEGLNDPSARMDFLKEKIGVEVAFSHASFIGIDLLKFQVASYSGFDRIDVGVYIVTTRNFQKRMKTDYQKKWESSLTFEKVVKYLPYFKSAIQVPIYVIGIDF